MAVTYSHAGILGQSLDNEVDISTPKVDGIPGQHSNSLHRDSTGKIHNVENGFEQPRKDIRVVAEEKPPRPRQDETITDFVQTFDKKSSRPEHPRKDRVDAETKPPHPRQAEKVTDFVRTYNKKPPPPPRQGEKVKDFVRTYNKKPPPPKQGEKVTDFVRTYNKKPPPPKQGEKVTDFVRTYRYNKKPPSPRQAEKVIDFVRTFNKPPPVQCTPVTNFIRKIRPDKGSFSADMTKSCPDPRHTQTHRQQRHAPIRRFHGIPIPRGRTDNKLPRGNKPGNKFDRGSKRNSRGGSKNKFAQGFRKSVGKKFGQGTQGGKFRQGIPKRFVK